MRDQASELRALMSGPRRWPQPEPIRGTAIVIGSGKGGVGKSLLAALLAAELARGGRRVLLFDACQNQGNLHVLLGLRPAARLEQLLSGEVGPEDLVIEAAERLWLLPGDSGDEALYGLTSADRARLHQRLAGLYGDYDVAIVDSGPGIESVVRATIGASRMVVVTTPEPASLSDSYALMKILAHQVPSLEVDVMVNRALTPEEGRAAFERLELAAERFLRRRVGYLGAVLEDAGLRRRALGSGSILDPAPASVSEIAARLPAAVARTGPPA